MLDGLNDLFATKYKHELNIGKKLSGKFNQNSIKEEVGNEIKSEVNIESHRVVGQIIYNKSTILIVLWFTCILYY